MGKKELNLDPRFALDLRRRLSQSAPGLFGPREDDATAGAKDAGKTDSLLFPSAGDRYVREETPVEPQEGEVSSARRREKKGDGFSPFEVLSRQLAKPKVEPKAEPEPDPIPPYVDLRSELEIEAEKGCGAKPPSLRELLEETRAERYKVGDLFEADPGPYVHKEEEAPRDDFRSRRRLLDSLLREDPVLDEHPDFGTMFVETPDASNFSRQQDLWSERYRVDIQARLDADEALERQRNRQTDSRIAEERRKAEQLEEERAQVLAAERASAEAALVERATADRLSAERRAADLQHAWTNDDLHHR